MGSFQIKSLIPTSGGSSIGCLARRLKATQIVTVYCREVADTLIIFCCVATECDLNTSQVTDFRAKVAGTTSSKDQQLPPSCCPLSTAALLKTRVGLMSMLLRVYQLLPLHLPPCIHGDGWFQMLGGNILRWSLIWNTFICYANCQ